MIIGMMKKPSLGVALLDIACNAWARSFSCLGEKSINEIITKPDSIKERY